MCPGFSLELVGETDEEGLSDVQTEILRNQLGESGVRGAQWVETQSVEVPGVGGAVRQDISNDKSVWRGEVESVLGLGGWQQKRRKEGVQKQLQQYQGPGGPEEPIFPFTHHPSES